MTTKMMRSWKTFSCFGLRQMQLSRLCRPGCLRLKRNRLDTRGADIIEAILRGAHSLKGAAGL